MRTVDVLEKDGQGLNLTFEVRDGIRNHQTKGNPATLEGKIVRLSDKIAYLHHDCDDAIRAGILKEEDIPKEIQETVGRTTGERLDHFIHDIVTNSSGKNEICMSPAVGEGLKKLRAFLYVNVYTNPYAKSEEGKAELLVETLYEYYLHRPEKMSPEYRMLMERGEPRERVVCDYIGAMTDRFAIAVYEEIYIPKCWPVK